MRLHPQRHVQDYRSRGWWTDETVDDLLRARVAEQPDRLALVDAPNKPDVMGMPPRRWSWRELGEQVDRLAALLVSRGIAHGDVVAVQLPNSVELTQTFLAVARIGAILTPFPVQYREHELVSLCRRTQAAAFLTSTRVADRANAALIREASADVPSLRCLLAWGGQVPDGVEPLDELLAAPVDAAALSGDLEQLRVDPNDCLTICWTSGTEATPKGVPRCHYDWLAITWGTVEAPDMSADDVVLNPFPMTNMAGIAGLFLPWLRVGCVLVQHHPFDLSVFLQQVGQERVTYTVAPPAVLTMLLQREDVLAAADISSLRILGSGSAPLAPAMVRGWQQRYGIGIINFFGSNEGTALLSAPIDIPDPEERARYFPRYGVAGLSWHTRIANQTASKLVDVETGTEITRPGRPGELRIKGPTVFAGYLGPDAPGAFDGQGFFRTGDVFEIAGPDGQYLQHVDRAKDIIIRGGMNIAPAELEGLIAAHPKVAEVAVIGVPDTVLGERTCAVVVVREGERVSLDELVAFLQEARIASFKLPERLETVSALPRNPLGKVLKHELRGQVTTVA